MDAGNLIALIAALDGRPMRTRPGNWNARFDGAVDVAGVRRAGEQVIFTLTVPTGPTDGGDFVSQSELDTGTTDKIQIVARDEDGCSHGSPAPRGEERVALPVRVNRGRDRLTCTCSGSSSVRSTSRLFRDRSPSAW